MKQDRTKLKPHTLVYGDVVLLRQTAFRPYLQTSNQSIFDSIYQSCDITNYNQCAMANIILTNLSLVYHSLVIAKNNRYFQPNYLYGLYSKNGLPYFTYHIFKTVIGKLNDGGMLSVISGGWCEDTDKKHMICSLIMPTHKLTTWRKSQGSFDITFKGIGSYIKIEEDPDIFVNRNGDVKTNNRNGYQVKSLPDTKAAMAVERLIQRYNTFIDTANFTYTGNIEDTPNFTGRYLRRLYIGNMSRYGRFHGAFWINMKECHRKHLRIDGESLLDFDFVSFFPTLLYKSVGIDLHETDIKPYYFDKGTIDRKVSKLIFNIMINTDQGKSKSVRGLLHRAFEGFINSPAYKEKYRWTYTQDRIKEIISLLWDHNKPIQDLLFSKKRFFKLTKIESDLMAGIMKYCIDNNVIILPVHDGLLCRASDKKIVEDAFIKTDYSYTIEELKIDTVSDCNNTIHDNNHTQSIERFVE